MRCPSCDSTGGVIVAGKPPPTSLKRSASYAAGGFVGCRDMRLWPTVLVLSRRWKPLLSDLYPGNAPKESSE